ncbi:unnamed protein product [Bursaphelenchus okinawaensis]|uniref:DUF148 domain-containing protein n=1 Tax=Bursaphelenchus okinawaensis TaxID=465554 RepID=A0A811K2B4_9BILA|nr:unnamed protein product [Bursaphelenchus okinawaensis]CAG9090448.1 unnamed protein product [Bursaphelenchus okinawaensis]
MKAILAVSALACAMAFPQPHPPPMPLPGPNGGPAGGPFWIIYKDLNETQQKDLNEILEKNKDSSKKVFKEELNKFKATLSDDLQNTLKVEKEKFEGFKKEIDSKADKMSTDAKALFDQLKKIVEDDSLSFKEEYEKAKELVKKADKSVLDEFRKNRVPLPGTPPPPHLPRGGPLGHVYDKLTKEQQTQVDQLMKEGRTQPKKEARANMDKFIDSLSEDLKKIVKEGKERRQGFKKNIDEKVAKLSEEARKVHKEMREIMENDTITFEEDHEKMKALVDRTDKKILDEFREARIPIPGMFPPPGMLPPPGKLGLPEVMPSPAPQN